jgi:hypothetical protein
MVSNWVTADVEIGLHPPADSMPLPGSRRFLAWLIGAPIVLGRHPTLSAHESESVTNLSRLQRERERERNKQAARGRSTQYTNNSDPITSTSELLLRLNSVTAHAHQS